jgi:ribosomal protein S12 methylthiotransferase
LPPKRTRKKNAPKSLAIISLGCPKNLVDTEYMLGQLRKANFRQTDQVEGADCVLVNTCGFIDTARAEALEVIDQLQQLKADGQIGSIVVTGCLAQRDGESLFEQCPGIDQVVGVFSREKVVEAVAAACKGPESPPSDLSSRLFLLDQPEGPPPIDVPRRRLTPRHTAYLRLSEGCDRSCSFCSIPSIRGSHASKPIEMIVDEARRLADEGVRELILIAQDTNYYGIDLYGKSSLEKLLAQLERVDRIAWIRLMYLYPKFWDEALIDRIAGSRKILPYLDLPLQHINNEVLRRMNRSVTTEQTKDLLARLRDRIDGLTLRTTFLVGFPGETESQFEELLEFVAEQRFERLGVFAYRREPGTGSDSLDGHLDESVKQDRFERLMSLQQKIVFEANEKLIGQHRDVLIDQEMPDERNVYLGRTVADAPEVDGVVYLTDDRLRVGQIVECEIVAFEGYDLVAAPID